MINNKLLRLTFSLLDFGKENPRLFNSIKWIFQFQLLTTVFFFTYPFVYKCLVQSLSCVQLFATSWNAAHQASLSFTISWSLLKFMSIESMMPSKDLILCHPLLLLSSIFPSIRVFSNESALWSGGQSIGASPLASDLPMSIQGWFPLGLTVSISLLSRDSQESSPAPQFESINPSVFSFLYGPTLTSVHDYWKDHSFDCSL